MGTIGTIATFAALLCIVVTIATALVAARKSDDKIVRIAEYATYGTAVALTASVGALQLALITADYSLQYVADYTSNALPVFYRIGSMWAGQGGSLLLWAWMVSVFAAWITYANRYKNWGMSVYTTAVFSLVAGLFTVLVLFFASPFVAATEVIADGFGLNPLLQDPLQIIHPLALYAGYVLYTVPFAIIVGSLIAGDVSGAWLKIAQRWNVIAWIALTAGIVLGARWAYAELGWGGYWAWDPVENASLLPWLTGTILLHTGMTLRNSKRIRMAAVIVVMVTFNLCLFGTFLTRSGVISSVHAFGESNLGTVLGAAIAVSVLACGALVVWRLPQLRFPDPEKRSHGWLGQLILLLLITAITVAVLWGTMFPLFNRVITGEEIAVTPGFFRVVVTPMGIAILALFAVSPLLPGQQVENLKREIGIRIVVFLAIFGGIMLVTHGANGGVALVLALSALALMTVVRKATPRLKDAYENDASPILGAIRASGPYVGHVGLVVMLAAVTLNVAFQASGQAKVTVGQTVTIGDQVVRLDSATINQFADRQSLAATVSVLSADNLVQGVVQARLEAFANSEQLHNEVGIMATPARDVYVVVDALEDDTPGSEVLTLTVYDNPAVVWLWIGGALLVLGGILYAIPRRRRITPESQEVEAMTAEDELSQLLDAAIMAARKPSGSEPTSAAVAELLAKAEDLSRGAGESEADPDEVVAFLERAKLSVSAGAAASATAGGAGSRRSEPAPAPPLAAGPSGEPKKRPTGLYVVAGVVAAAVVVIAAFLVGKSSSSDVPGFTGPPTNASASAAPAAGGASAQPVDQAQVAALMQKISTDPKDSASLQSLGDIYYSANDYKTALTFYDKVVVLKPKDEGAWIAVAASAYNSGDDKKAFTAWNNSLEINPDNIEAHYGLGFYYLSQTPADEAKAKTEWQKVIDIDPTSDLAKTVQSHIDSLAASPSPSPAAS